MPLNFDEMTPVPMGHFKGGVGTLQARPYDDGNCKVLRDDAAAGDVHRPAHPRGEL